MSKIGNPANKAQFANSNEYIMVGNSIKHQPQLKQFGAQTSQKKINVELNNKTDSLTVDLICFITKKEREERQAAAEQAARNEEESVKKSSLQATDKQQALTTLDTMMEKQNETQNEEVTTKLDDLLAARLQNDNSIGQIRGPNSQFSTGDLMIDQDRPSTEQKQLRPKIARQVRGYSAANATGGKRNIKALLPSKNSVISSQQMKYDFMNN